jgi:hypothetical protein
MSKDSIADLLVNGDRAQNPQIEVMLTSVRVRFDPNNEGKEAQRDRTWIEAFYVPVGKNEQCHMTMTVSRVIKKESIRDTPDKLYVVPGNPSYVDISETERAAHQFAQAGLLDELNRVYGAYKETFQELPLGRIRFGGTNPKTGASTAKVLYLLDNKEFKAEARHGGRISDKFLSQLPRATVSVGSWIDNITKEKRTNLSFSGAGRTIEEDVVL